MDIKALLIRGSKVLAAAALLAALMAFAAFAEDVSVNFMAEGTSGHIIYDSTGVGGTPLPDNCYLQLIKSPDAIINPPGGSAGEMGGNDTLVTADAVHIGDNSGDVAGTFVKFISNVPSGYYVYVRAWDATSPSGASHFGNSNMISVILSDPPSVVDFNVNSFATTQLKSAPILTSVGASGVDHDDSVVTVNVSPSTPVASGTPNLSGFAYLIEWKKSIQSWPQGSQQYQNSPSLALEGLDGGTTYNVKAKAANYFGESGYSETVFTTEAYPWPISGNASDLRIELNPSGQPAGSVKLTWTGTDANTCEVYATTEASGNYVLLATVDIGGPSFTYTHTSPGAERYYKVRAQNGLYAPETVGKYTFDLEKSTTGINSVSMPFDTTIAGNSPRISTAANVAASIGSGFEFIGGWDKANQTEFAYLSGGMGTNFGIQKGEGYQISVSANKSWTIVGQK